MARTNDGQDEKIEETLHKLTGRFQEILFRAANTSQTESTFGYKERFFQTMQAGVQAMMPHVASALDAYLPNAGRSVLDRLKEYGAKYSGEEIKLNTYVRMVESMTNSVSQYRYHIDEEIRARERKGQVTTAMDLREIINRDLRADDLTVVRYQNGRNIPVDKYATMLARTTRAETENHTMIQQALREGIDLVECDTVSPTCDSCAVYQGRVYSISGKDNRYPALYKTAFQSGYSIIHPNCRHSWSPYHEELYTEDEKAEMRSRSQRSMKPDGDGRRFQQTERLREEYARGQAKMRQWNAELVEYERMKAFYKAKGEEPPYKTLGAFRREVRKAKNEQSKALFVMRSRLADVNRGDIPLGRALPLRKELIEGKQYDAKFAQMITDDRAADKLAHKIAVQSRKILIENKGKKEETAVGISLTTGEVLFEQHSNGLVMRVDTSSLSRQPVDSVVLTHNHPMGSSFSETDLEFMGSNPQIHTIIAVTPKGKKFSLRTNCGKRVDRYVVSEYNKNIREGLTRGEALHEMAKKYGWEYKEV